MSPVSLSFGDLLALLVDSIIIVSLVIFGTLAVVNPDLLQSRYRRLYERYNVIRMWPFSDIVLKPWYLVWLRIGGVLVWGFAALGAYAIWMHLQH